MAKYDEWRNELINIGDKLLTDYYKVCYNDEYDLTEVTVTGIFKEIASSSGVCFTVAPVLMNKPLDTMFDSGWFKTIRKL